MVAVFGALMVVVVETAPPTTNGTELEMKACVSTFHTDRERVAAVAGVVKLKFTLE
jgi:hypothetical protein